tara:strand:- start:204 stop:713 length:510 start_codon:yes stop_codon:yes gene_type:complete
MRKLIAGLLLTVALPAFASISEDLEAGITADQAIAKAVAACDGSANCQFSVVQEALSAGIDVNSVLSSAVANGVDYRDVSDAVVDAGYLSRPDAESALAIVLANLGVTNPTASGGTGGGFNAAPTNNGQTAPGLTTTTQFDTGEGLITIPVEEPTGPTPSFPDPISPAG